MTTAGEAAAARSIDVEIIRLRARLLELENEVNQNEDRRGMPAMQTGCAEEAIARQRLESVGVLAAGIAHDFNNLLGSIVAESELALTDVPPGTAAAEEIHRIKALALRAAEIVRELMIYAGQETARLERVDISCLVDEMLQLLTVSISKHAVLKTSLAKNLPAVLANPAQIRQVVMNLIINASKAIGEQEGVIHVSTEQVTLLKQEHIRLEVSDTGCGITAEAQARMFDPFFRPRFAGRGLGLAVVQRIVHSHNGAIHLRSAPGQGATFEILLPSNGEPAPKNTTIPVPASHVRRSGAKAPTILLVEDEDTLRLSVSKMLCARGFSVIQARDGSAAIDLVRSHKVDIDGILLDVTLPGASSRAVFEEARRLRPKVKPIVTSAYNEKMAMTSTEAPQGGRFIRKPYQIDDLVRLLWEALGTG